MTTETPDRSRPQDTDSCEPKVEASNDSGDGASKTGLAGYAKVLRTPGMTAWSAAVLCQRLPIAMSPLALVYVGHAATGSYGTGALLSGAFAFAEAGGAGVMGRRFDRRPASSELRLVLGVQAVALLLLGLLAVVPHLAAPVWALAALAAIAGAVASGAHGGLRALLVRTVERPAHQAALSLESTATTAVWAVGPAIVGLIAVLAGPAWPMVAIGVIAGLGVIVAGLMKDPGPGPVESVHSNLAHVVKLSWPALLQEGAVLACVGAAYSALPSLLQTLGTSPDLAGPLLAAFALAGIVGGLIYGSRRWPGAYRTQSVLLVLGITAAIAAAAVSPTVALMIIFVTVSGLLGTPALTARAAGVQEILPESTWAAGFSALYAAGGVGFGMAGIITALLLGPAGPRQALMACAVLAAVAAVVGAVGERRRAASVAAHEL
jgi:MFS family permease